MYMYLPLVFAAPVSSEDLPFPFSALLIFSRVFDCCSAPVELLFEPRLSRSEPSEGEEECVCVWLLQLLYMVHIHLTETSVTVRVPGEG